MQEIRPKWKRKIVNWNGKTLKIYERNGKTRCLTTTSRKAERSMRNFWKKKQSENCRNGSKSRRSPISRNLQTIRLDYDLVDF